MKKATKRTPPLPGERRTRRQTLEQLANQISNETVYKPESARAERFAVVFGGAAKRKHWKAWYDDYRGSKVDFEIWGINGIRHQWVPWWDRMFNIHRYALLKEYGFPTEIEVAWSAQNRKIPFYTADPWPDHESLYNWRLFPREQLRAYPRPDYHVNSFDWLIAFGLHSGFTKMRFHGVQLALSAVSEQLSSRACFEYWAGYAEGRGMKIELAPDCDMFYAYHIVRSERIYGYDDCPAWEDRTKTAPKGAPYRYDE